MIYPSTLNRIYFSAHVHGPDCDHDHDKHSHVEGGDSFEHHHHDHAPEAQKLGVKFKNPIVRGVMNFFGWFYEFFASFFKDISGKKPDEVHEHDHSDPHHKH